jgi:hypothetical protein
MLTKDETDVIDVFRKDLFRSYTIRELMKAMGRKTYTWTFNTTKKLVKLGMLNMETKGNSNICSINLYSPLAFSYLSLLDETEAVSRKIPRLDELINEIPTHFFTLLVGGSYVEGKQTQKSDLDICVIVDDAADTQKIQRMLDNKIMIPRLHPFAFRKSEFVKMLLSKEANYGRMLFRKRLIPFGAENYYLMIREAVENGFRG